MPPCLRGKFIPAYDLRINTETMEMHTRSVACKVQGLFSEEHPNKKSKGKSSAAVPNGNEYRHAKDAKIDARKRVQKNYSTPPLFELCELTLW